MILQEFIVQEQSIQETGYLHDDSKEGARLVFWGLVRDTNLGYTDIQKIEYSCYPELTVKEGRTILEEACERFAVRRVHCVHRIGVLALQDRAIRVEVGSAHRAPALEACAYIMDEIKKRLPVWKKEYSAGQGRWVDGES